MKLTCFFSDFLLLAVSFSADSLRLNTRKQMKAGDKFVSKTEVTKWDAKKTVVVICDMWSKHWCANATGRVCEMAQQMNAVVEAARKKGCLNHSLPKRGDEALLGSWRQGSGEPVSVLAGNPSNEP